VTGPTSEPLTLLDVKNYLRLPSSFTNDDALITSLITAARLDCERINSRSFVSTQWQLVMDYFPPYSSRFTSLLPPAIVGANSDRNYWLNLSDVAITLPMPPLISVDSIQYYDPSGVLQTLDVSPSAANITYSTGTPGQITPFYGKIFPVTQPRLSAVIIKYTCGYSADASLVPVSVLQAMRLLVSHYYEHRTSDETIPQAVYSLLDGTSQGLYA
jgi:hypothetical protein